MTPNTYDDHGLIEEIKTVTYQYLEGLITPDEMANMVAHTLQQYGRI